MYDKYLVLGTTRTDRQRPCYSRTASPRGVFFIHKRGGRLETTPERLRAPRITSVGSMTPRKGCGCLLFPSPVCGITDGNLVSGTGIITSDRQRVNAYMVRAQQSAITPSLCVDLSLPPRTSSGALLRSERQRIGRLEQRHAPCASLWDSTSTTSALDVTAMQSTVFVLQSADRGLSKLTRLKRGAVASLPVCTMRTAPLHQVQSSA